MYVYRSSKTVVVNDDDDANDDFGQTNDEIDSWSSVVFDPTNFNGKNSLPSSSHCVKRPRICQNSYFSDEEDFLCDD